MSRLKTWYNCRKVAVLGDLSTKFGFEYVLKNFPSTSDYVVQNESNQMNLRCHLACAIKYADDASWDKHQEKTVDSIQSLGCFPDPVDAAYLCMSIPNVTCVRPVDAAAGGAGRQRGQLILNEITRRFNDIVRKNPGSKISKQRHRNWVKALLEAPFMPDLLEQAMAFEALREVTQWDDELAALLIEATMERRGINVLWRVIGSLDRTFITALTSVMRIHENVLVRERAAFGLGLLGEASVLVSLIGNGQETQTVRRVVLSVLRSLADNKPWIHLLAGKLSEPTAKRSTLSLLKAAGPSAISFLLDRFKHSDWMTRANVAWFLGELGGQRAHEALRNTSLSDPDWTVRLAAEEALGTTL